MDNPWETLFSYAVQQLDNAKVAKVDWSFGGGTVLRQKFNHRESKDIDIFFRNGQLLNFVSPRVNDGTEAHLKFYTESSTVVRLQFQEGEIDFIAAPQLSLEKPRLQKILNQYVYVDHPVEIVAKKIHFRAEDFKPRDVFDLAVVYAAQKPILLENAHVFAEKLEVLEARIADLHSSGVLEPGLQSLALSPGGQKVRGKEYGMCIAFIEAMQKKLELDRKMGRSFVQKQGLSL